MFSLLGLFTGDFNWKAIAVVLGLALVSGGLYHVVKVSTLNSKIELLDKDIATKAEELKEAGDVIIKKRSEIEAQNAVIKQNEVDKEKNIAEVKEAKVEIKERFRVIVRNVDTFKGDSNATDCQNLKSFARGLTW